MSEAYLGEIRLFAGTYAPNGWAICRGQTFSIRQYSALYSLLGTTYGGDGLTTFALPNLQGRVVMGSDSGSNVGEEEGSERVTLLTTEMPAHTHLPAAATSRANAQASPEGAVWALTPRTPYATSTAGGKSMNMMSVLPAGGSQPHDNMMPFLVLNYCICLDGQFPPRP